MILGEDYYLTNDLIATLFVAQPLLHNLIAASYQFSSSVLKYACITKCSLI